MEPTSANLTAAAARALDAARRLALQNQAPDPRPIDLLLGLLEEEQGRVASLLSEGGIPPAELRQCLLSRQRISASAPCGTEPSAEDIFRQAREVVADIGGDRQIASEHVLLATVRLDAGLREELEGRGLTIAYLESRIIRSQVPSLELDEPLELSQTAEEIDTARVLDAASNRAREALRVLEDYARFVLDDSFLTGELKKLRHELTQVIDRLPPRLLLNARETSRDVGTRIATEHEHQRYSPAHVAQANGKRLQEALRTLEEYGKLRSPEIGMALESLRYQSYTLERAILLGCDARQRLAEARLYVLLTGKHCHASLDWTIQEAAAGGAQIFQLREKDLTDRELLQRARDVRRWTKRAGALFIMNDRPDIALLVQADGVHIGQDELPVKEARRIVGPDALIGVSTHNISQLRKAILDGASYVGIGPSFPSGTKQFEELAGVAFIEQAARETSLPAFAIGGINRNTLPQAIGAGARRIAVSQAICQAEDPRAAAAELRKLL